MELIITTKEDLENMLAKMFNRFFLENQNLSSKTYTVNELANKLHRGNRTIKKLVDSKVLETTPDGRITEQSVNKYLKQN